ncbi:hypothetical protein [Methylobacterium gnaphalii]|uniref:Uncharacterized protein n=1 Tax=Methylobacterium gnaphalii TaxID=1010610 RepID=A0A512JIT6_9HYPH|nr:hypothetical protein [Methylobacterium gnaphalii]GEP09870.1 hypothetical protein MGN01_17150 [Methylobacterium gnaphalii]GJD67214.1 hypothetical protein MMMDOFMJ_0128 [Methylobacterium gnaphalii]GLS49899.1 hypothetical protein GCM10007885_27510 [Methylobacterium gnaphalii]
MSAERAIANMLGQVTPEAAADMLHKHGVGLLNIATETGMVEVLNHVLREHRIRLARAPEDFKAVRSELARLIVGDVRGQPHPPHFASVSAQSRALAEKLSLTRKGE